MSATVAPRLTITSDSDNWVRELGRVESWHIGKEDHGLLSFNLSFAFGGSGQGTGHYCLGSRKRGYVTVAFLDAICDVLGPMQDWKGRMVHVLRLEPYGQIVGIESLPTAREYQRVIFKAAFGEAYGGEE